MTINDRDRAILEFIAICPSNSFIIQELFFPSLQTCQRRLTKLHEAKLVKRYKSHMGDNYIYYIEKKPKQVEHTLYVSKLYAYWVRNDYRIMKFKCTPELPGIIPDAIAVVKYKNVSYTYLVEVERSNNPIGKKIKAYEEFFLKDSMELLGCKPLVLFITNKKVPSCSFEHEVLRLDHI